MRIAWFTPFLKKSAIGLYSKYACEALRRKHDVWIYAPAAEELHETAVPVRQFDSAADISWDEIDICFYNIGDNSLYHSQIVDCLMQHPGILILHDHSILNLWVGYYIAHRNSLDELRSVLESQYAAAGADEILNAMSDVQKWNALDYERYSGLELLLPYAKGVLVHSNYHKEFVRRFYGGPIKVAYFPFPCDRPCPSKRKQHETIQLLTVGNVNPNKRIAQVIEAIGREKQLSQHIRYTVAGGLENKLYVANLENLIKRYHLEDRVLLNGYTTDEELEEFYQAADILINLRNPALEGASWSLVEQMYTGKPIIVSNTGFYGEMPEGCVYPISADMSQEITEIQKALRWMAEHWDQAQEIGQNAYLCAKTSFSPEQYAEKVADFLNIQAFQEPLEQLIDYVCYEFQAIGVDNSMEICREYADELEKLFFRPSDRTDRTTGKS